MSQPFLLPTKQQMKKLLFLLLFPLFVNGQGLYIESNIGIANIDGDIFPGTSVLFGKRFEKAESNFLLDMEIGLAFPTIITGKIGFGFFIDKEEKSAIVLGIRPWPLHFYTQININEGPRGQWILSFEAGSALIDRSIGNIYLDELSFYSNGIINFGYRWNIGKK